MTPSETAIAEMILINQWISLFKGVCSFLALYARFAICPITVLSPVLNTTPTPTP